MGKRRKSGKKTRGVDRQDDRIQAVLGGRDPSDVEREDGIDLFFEHLSRNLELPCVVKGLEDFRWEEFYVMGPGDPGEYAELRITCPSFRDLHDLLRIEKDPESEWMLFEEDIGAHVRRKSDGREFCLGLAELDPVDRKSRNAQLIRDYADWFVNYR